MTMPPEPPGPPGPPSPPPGSPTPPPAGGFPGGQPAGVPRPAEIQNRFLARLIDHIILGVISVPIFFILSAILYSGISNSFGETFIFWTLDAILIAAISLGYFAFLESSRGQTVGKMVMKLRTYGPDGVSNPTMEQAVKRNIYAGLYILGIIPFIGWFLLYWAAPAAVAIYHAVTLNSDQPNHQGFLDKFAGGTQVKQIG
jgi:uncharacterized RDD family membrane protein YckC